MASVPSGNKPLPEPMLIWIYFAYVDPGLFAYTRIYFAYDVIRLQWINVMYIHKPQCNEQNNQGII